MAQLPGTGPLPPDKPPLPTVIPNDEAAKAAEALWNDPVRVMRFLLDKVVSDPAAAKRWRDWINQQLTKP
jgi:hypothetical protein